MSEYSVVKADPAVETFQIDLMCAKSGVIKSTRLLNGRDFDDALDRSLETQPETDFIIGSVSRWDSGTQSWQQLDTPTFTFNG